MRQARDSSSFLRDQRLSQRRCTSSSDLGDGGNGTPGVVVVLVGALVSHNSIPSLSEMWRTLDVLGCEQTAGPSLRMTRVAEIRQREAVCCWALPGWCMTAWAAWSRVGVPGSWVKRERSSSSWKEMLLKRRALPSR